MSTLYYVLLVPQTNFRNDYQLQQLLYVFATRAFHFYRIGTSRLHFVLVAYGVNVVQRLGSFQREYACSDGLSNVFVHGFCARARNAVLIRQGSTLARVL